MLIDDCEMITGNPAGGGVRVHREPIREERLGDALASVASGVSFRSGPGQVDCVVTDAGGRTAVVEAKFRRYGSFSSRDLQEAINQVESYLADERRSHDHANAGILIVTNAALSSDVLDFNARPLEGRPVEVVSWNGDADNGLLARALGRIAR